MLNVINVALYMHEYPGIMYIMYMCISMQNIREYMDIMQELYIREWE